MTYLAFKTNYLQYSVSVALQHIGTNSDHFLLLTFQVITVLAAPLSQQLQPKWIGLRTLYTAREAPSKMYRWQVMVFSNMIGKSTVDR